MEEIRIHGRGGQGNVAAAEMLGIAAFADGRYAQAFPAFGAERTGAPVMAFVRVSDRPIRRHSQVYEPDAVIVQDATLLAIVDVTRGLKPGGLLLINSDQSPAALGLKSRARVVTVPATQIALETIGRPIPNTTLLGAFVAASGLISLRALQESVRERFAGEAGERNAQAVQQAYDYVCHTPAVDNDPAPTLVPPPGHKKPPMKPATPTFYVDVVAQPASSLAYKTGSWRTFRPVFKGVKCTGCNLCVVYCPEGIVYSQAQKQYQANYDYCKGCGICAAECPQNDIEMVLEGEAHA